MKGIDLGRPPPPSELANPAPRNRPRGEAASRRSTASKATTARRRADSAVVFAWYVIRVATRTERRGRGRPSLSGGGESPQLRVRLSDDVRAALSRRAAREGVTVSELARRVLTTTAEARPENAVQLELHRTLLGKLLTDLGPARAIARRNLERMRDSVRGAQARSWLDEWSELVDEAGPRLVDVFLGEDERSIDLRQVSPFAGLLTQEEREASIERARRHAAL